MLSLMCEKDVVRRSKLYQGCGNLWDRDDDFLSVDGKRSPNAGIPCLIRTRILLSRSSFNVSFECDHVFGSRLSFLNIK